MNSLDEDGNGTLSKTELKKLDTNNDGTLTKKEFSAQLKSMGYSTTEQRLFWINITGTKIINQKKVTTSKGNQSVIQTSNGKTVETTFNSSGKLISKTVINKDNSKTTTTYKNEKQNTVTQYNTEGEATNVKTYNTDGKITNKKII